MLDEIIVSVDLETDGPVPGIYSIRSIGAVAYKNDGQMIDTFYETLLPLDNAYEYEPTIEWYRTKEPQAWRAILDNPDHPDLVIRRFYRWISDLPGTPVMVCWPLGFDQPFTHWYFWRFIGDDPFSHSGVCLKQMAAEILGVPYRSIQKKNLPVEWFDDNLKHTHIAIDDAMEQGHLYFVMRDILNNMRDGYDKYISLLKQIGGTVDKNGDYISDKAFSGYTIGKYQE